jgi:hypothetical protein
LNNIAEICVPPTGCSDHFPVCFTWRKKGVKIPKLYHKTITYRSFKHFVEANFLLELSQSPLCGVYNITDANAAIEFWHKEFLNIYNKHAPLCTKRVKHYNKPEWLDDELQSAIKKRDYFKKKGLESEFRKQRNVVTALKTRKNDTIF